MGFTGVITQLGCWENTRKACKSLACSKGVFWAGEQLKTRVLLARITLVFFVMVTVTKLGCILYLLQRYIHKGKSSEKIGSKSIRDF